MGFDNPTFDSAVRAQIEEYIVTDIKYKKEKDFYESDEVKSRINIYESSLDYIKHNYYDIIISHRK
jgi:hypothetical protein